MPEVDAAIAGQDAAVVGLASASPRRRELLLQIGVVHRRVAVDVDESLRSGEAAEDYVRRLARDKAEAGFASLAGRLPVLGADTSVVVDGCVLGKPACAADARRMLCLLAAREHDVMSAVAISSAQGTRVSLNRSRVRFRAIDQRELDIYCASAEPLDKAGGYAIQGRAAVFVEHLQGSYSGVMGLPLFETAALLAEVDIDVLAGA